ncbi:hypothetical protein H0H92_009620 [Tricholoma furcatifolium]|nr:hypothetical protein H0H92_009620 [Tricholoma furcatifolium]
MSLFAVLVFGVLALAPQVVRSLSFNFTFQLPEVEQCEPVSLTFTGNSYGYANTSSVSLTLVPFNSTPISIPIPETAYNISGVNVTFFPFADGTPFIALLDDASGENIALVSDIAQVLPSPTANASCLSGTAAVQASNYTLDNSTFSQYETFTLKYNHSVISQAPSVRVFIPGGASHFLNLTDDDKAGTATYLLSVKQGKEVVMVYDGGEGYQESSTLLTGWLFRNSESGQANKDVVGGNSSSSDSCLASQSTNSTQGTNTSSDSQAIGEPAKISLYASYLFYDGTLLTVFSIRRPIVIGASVAGGVVAAIAICMVVFLLRERRRKRQADPEANPSLTDKDQPSPSGLEEKRTSPTPIPTFMPHPGPTPTPTPSGYSPHILNGPIYTATGDGLRESMSSWSQPIPNDQRLSGRITSATYSIRGGELSFESLDIEAMLNMAAVASSRSSSQSDEPVPYGSPLYIEHSPSPQLTQMSSRQHIRESADVPHGPESMASALSLTSVVDPFADDAMKRHGQIGLPPSRKNSATSVALPPSRKSSDPSVRWPPSRKNSDDSVVLPARKNSATSTISSSANSSNQALGVPRAIIGLSSSSRHGLPLARKRSQDVLGAVHPDSRLSSVREHGFEEVGVAQ